MNGFVRYMNGLHSYNGQNQNAYGEKNIVSPYSSKTMVSMEVTDFIYDVLYNEAPHIIILTGHAGDGKTSIMYQVLEKMGIDPKFDDAIWEEDIANEKKCYCIKDFSELSDEEKFSTFKNVVRYPEQGKFVFMVANTGPLINTFGKLFPDEDREAAKIQLVDAMDYNDGELKEIFHHRLRIINVAAIDNTNFAPEFLEKILSEELWNPCEQCPKQAYCYIYRNRNLLKSNTHNAFKFIENFYIWQTEYGFRLTIRSMTEQLTYMITGGYDCEDVNPIPVHQMLFSDLFFGYDGITSNPDADNIIAVRNAKNSNVYQRKLRIDEELLIRRDYKHLFGKDVNEIISDTRQEIKMTKEWDNELKRMYLFMGVVKEDQHEKDVSDIFSKQFSAYIKVRNDEIKPTSAQKELVIDALRMIYLGTAIGRENSIPITMSTESGITQSVQLVAGELSKSNIELIKENLSKLNSGKKELRLRIKQKKSIRLTLPMMDYFEELKNGVIATNIDPQLSHGIENLKAELLSMADKNDDTIDIIVTNNNGLERKTFIMEDGMIYLQ